MVRVARRLLPALKVSALATGGVFWLLMALGSLLIAWNSLSYISLGLDHPFVIEKEPYSEGLFYRLMLWSHIAAGCVCLLSAVAQFSRPLLRRWPKVHVVLGLIYVWSTLAVVAPTGFYLALFAKGGVSGIGGFLLLGVVTTWFTWAGWRALRQGNIPAHRDWMIRSYAMNTTSVTFRALHVVFFLWEMPYAQNYLLSLWLGLLLNALAAEVPITAFRLPTQATANPTRQPERKHRHDQPTLNPV